jgi:hypothetical protein
LVPGYLRGRIAANNVVMETLYEVLSANLERPVAGALVKQPYLSPGKMAARALVK